MSSHAAPAATVNHLARALCSWARVAITAILVVVVPAVVAAIHDSPSDLTSWSTVRIVVWPAIGAGVLTLANGLRTGTAWGRGATGDQFEQAAAAVASFARAFGAAFFAAAAPALLHAAGAGQLGSLDALTAILLPLLSASGLTAVNAVRAGGEYGAGVDLTEAPLGTLALVLARMLGIDVTVPAAGAGWATPVEDADAPVGDGGDS